MSSARTVENPAGTPIDNLIDTGRKWPSTAVADRIATSEDTGVRLGSPVMEKMVGFGVGASLDLARPVARILHIQSYVTATGYFPTAVTKANLAETTDYTVTKRDATTGKGKLTNTSGTSYAASTLLIWYQPDESEGTIGGQSVAARSSNNFPAQ